MKKTDVLFAMFIALVLSFYVGCSQSASPFAEGTPSWLQALVEGLEVDPSVPAQACQATYNGETVYFVSATMPEGYGCLFDESGKQIGCPDGGMDGKGDGKCSDFFDERSDVKVLWESGG